MNTLRTNRTRRLFILQGAALAVSAGLVRQTSAGALAQEEANTPPVGTGTSRQEIIDALNAGGFLWTATSPATRAGDVFSISFSNRASEPLSLWVRTIIMDHQAHHNESVVEERFELTAGESRTFDATNNYGQANHFSTRLIVDTSDFDSLGLKVTLVDQTGVETATFNERAFWIKSAAEIKAAAGQRREEREMESDHAGH